MVDDNDVAVDVDLSGAPVLNAPMVADHEAGEPRVLDHARLPDFLPNRLYVDGVLQPNHTVDYLVHLWLQKQPPRRR